MKETLLRIGCMSDERRLVAQRGHRSSIGPKVRGTRKEESCSNERYLCPDIIFCPVAGAFSCLLLPLLILTLDICGMATPKSLALDFSHP